MDLPVREWLEVVPVRRSRRAYDGTPVPEHTLRRIESLAASWRPFSDARVTVARDAPASLFRGILGSYGKVTGAPSALLVIGSVRGPHASEHVGYTGEGMVLEATRQGVGTCWVGGFFDPVRAEELTTVAEHERVYAVSPLGIPLGSPPFAERLAFHPQRPKRRRELSEIAPGVETGEWPQWAAAGVRAAQSAPSAYHRQPWRFALESDSAVVLGYHGADTPGVSKRLDCGIAMLHFELGARAAGAGGGWEPLDRQAVARWRLRP